MTPLNNFGNQNDNYDVKIQFNGIKYDKFEFEIFITNKSNDSISVNPSLFNYTSFSEEEEIDNEIDSQLVYCINPEERIKQLKTQKNSLMNEDNPYSLVNKSVKEIAVEGLITGTIAVLFGQDAEELESQKEEDEYEWDQKHNLQLSKVDNELDFWNNNALIPCMVPLNSEISEAVLFPISKGAREIEIPIHNDVFTFRYTQSN